MVRNKVGYPLDAENEVCPCSSPFLRGFLSSLKTRYCFYSTSLITAPTLKLIWDILFLRHPPSTPNSIISSKHHIFCPVIVYISAVGNLKGCNLHSFLYPNIGLYYMTNNSHWTAYMTRMDACIAYRKRNCFLFVWEWFFRLCVTHLEDSICNLPTLYLRLYNITWFFFKRFIYVWAL